MNQPTQQITVWDDLRAMLQQQHRIIKAVLPEGVDSRRLEAIAFDAVRQTPKLKQCLATDDGRASFISAVMRSAKLGLPPDGVMGAIVPKGGRAVFLPMWRGLANLAYGSGMVKAIRADYVYTKDRFEYRDGLAQHLVHEKHRGEDRGELVAAWAVVDLMTGGQICKVLFQFDINRITQNVTGMDKSGAAWKDWEAEMWRKSAIKQALSAAPCSDDLRDALHMDDLADAGKSQPTIIDITPRDPSSSDVAAGMRQEAAQKAPQGSPPAERRPVATPPNKGTQPAATPHERDDQATPPEQPAPPDDEEPPADLYDPFAGLDDRR